VPNAYDDQRDNSQNRGWDMWAAMISGKFKPGQWDAFVKMHKRWHKEHKHQAEGLVSEYLVKTDEAGHHGMHIAVYAGKKAADKYLSDPETLAFVKEGMGYFTEHTVTQGEVIPA
jgi:quinol monooxygenase YgiN